MSGNLVRDPAVYTFSEDRKMCRFTLCVDTYSKGERHPNFFRWTAWGRSAESICKYFVKGSKITVSGYAVQTQKYENKGVEYPESVEFWLSSWDFAGERKATKKYSEKQKKQDDFMDLPDDISDELPFE